MKRILSLLVLVSALSQSSSTSGSSESPLVLWYSQPARNWNEALPIGNGRLGAMVFGGVSSERVQLNEDTVWAGEKRNRLNPLAAENLQEVRRLLFAGKPEQAEELAERAIIATPRRLPPYQPVGDLLLEFNHGDDVSEFRRELDLDSAVARVSYRSGGALYTREYFASHPDHAIVIRLASDGADRISFSATLDRERDSETRTDGPDRVIIDGEAISYGERQRDERKVGVRFRGVLQVLPEGGRMHAEDERIVVEGARAVTLLFVAATDFRHQDPARQCDEQLRQARKPFERLRADHIEDHRRLFRRVELDLAAPAPQIPTNERLERLGRGIADPALKALYFQFGRYLLIASSRPGTMAANLQGVWNDMLHPPWESKYTINANTQMNYWPAEVCNLSELHEPLFDLIDNALEDGRRVARGLYGAGGFVIHHNTDLWGHAVPIDGVHSGVWPMGGAWLSLHLWDHFDFNQDRDFLALRAYPVLKEAAQFLLDYLVESADGQLVTGPSISPENRYRLEDGTIARMCMGPAMDTQIARALFSRVIEAAQMLALDAEFIRTVEEARDRLPPFQIGRHGQLQEWLEDYDEPDPGHRHISHLFALHPDNQITIRGTPELARAARVSLERRLGTGGGHTGWSRAWIINFWARLEEGDHAHRNLLTLLTESTLPNLMDTHPPFQIDGNLGGAAGIAEMLLQSHSGEIHFLPALPAAWPKGSIRGLRARGAVEIDLVWDSGKAVTATLKADADGERVLRPPNGQRIDSVSESGRTIPFREDADGPVRLNVSVGSKYQIAFR